MRRALNKKDLEEIKYFFNKYYHDNKQINLNMFFEETLELLIDKYNFKKELEVIGIINKEHESDAFYYQGENELYLNKTMLKYNEEEIYHIFKQEGITISEETLRYLSYLLCVETIIHELEHKNQDENILFLKNDYTKEEIELLRYSDPVINKNLYMTEYKKHNNPTPRKEIKELKRINKIYRKVCKKLYNFDPIERQAYIISTEYSKELVDTTPDISQATNLLFLNHEMSNKLNGYQPIKKLQEAFSPTKAYLTLQDKTILIPKITLLQNENLSLEERLFSGAKITPKEFDNLTKNFNEKIKSLKLNM